ncbi:zinc finger protein 224-like [Saccostrea echinata]|uniref:zinc finger protein 224-like n=1 Tax=Saccostrea echinata TaxID=191078 RepID=UPI002A7F51E5|nr:zinc finger protein 224-like [Saccostrea echinata]
MENKSQKRFPCLQCKRTYSRKHDMERHVDICHTATADKPFRCEQCKFVFSTEEKLRTHENDHSQEMKFRCQICDKAFKTSNTWKRHMRAHLDPKPFVCQICRREFGREHDMYRHTVRMHTGERKFQCDMCPSKFAWFSDLTIHKRRHNVMGKFRKRRKLGANGDVSKKVKKKVQLKKKEEKAEHVNQLVCKMCSQSFTSFSSLQLHICDLGSSVEEVEEIRDDLVSSKNNHTCEEDTESFSALQHQKCDNKSSSKIQENRESEKGRDSFELDKGSDQGHAEDFIFEKDHVDSMGDSDFDTENVDSLENSNTLSSITNTSRLCSPKSNAPQNKEIENIRSLSQSVESLVTEKTVNGVVPSTDTMESKNPGEQSIPLTDIENLDTYSESNINIKSKNDEVLNLQCHVDKNPESLIHMNKNSTSNVCVIPFAEVDACQESNVPINGNINANSKIQLITNSKSEQDKTMEISDECLKCKVCQKEFSKFSALQLHLCEESLNKEESSKIRNHITGDILSHSKDMKKMERPSQNSSQLERMVTRSKSFNTKTSQNTPSLKMSTVTISKGSVKKEKGRSVKKIESSPGSSTKEKIIPAKNSTDQLPYRCEECSEMFLKLHELKKHSLMEHKKKVTFTCSICRKVFETKSKLEIHLYSHESVQPHQCEDCGHKFKHKRDLLRHKLNHGDEGPLFKCSFCRKEYSRQYDLRRHIECVHPAKAPYRCEICHAAFTNSEECNKHLTTHEKTHPYTCDICQRGLSSLPILKRHMRMHSNEKLYSCPECNKGFNRRHDMYQHAKIHGTERFTCDLCYRKFVTDGYLRKHMKKKHGLSNNPNN